MGFMMMTSVIYNLLLLIHVAVTVLLKININNSIDTSI